MLVIFISRAQFASSVLEDVFDGGDDGFAFAAEEAELSDRESAVVRLIAAGHSNKEIAGQLELSVKTVETYKARSLEKLGMHSRADLVRYALQRGWLQEMG